MLYTTDHESTTVSCREGYGALRKRVGRSRSCSRSVTVTVFPGATSASRREGGRVAWAAEDRGRLAVSRERNRDAVERVRTTDEPHTYLFTVRFDLLLSYHRLYNVFVV